MEQNMDDDKGAGVFIELLGIWVLGFLANPLA